MNRHNYLHEQTLYMEQALGICCGHPNEDELPQVGGEEDVLLDLLQDQDFLPRDQIRAEIHHQNIQ